MGIAKRLPMLCQVAPGLRPAGISGYCKRALRYFDLGANAATVQVSNPRLSCIRGSPQWPCICAGSISRLAKPVLCRICATCRCLTVDPLPIPSDVLDAMLLAGKAALELVLRGMLSGEYNSRTVT